MSFAINPSLNHIDLPEACVYELYRSSSEVRLADARFHGHTCEAYICIAKIDKKIKAYVAILETGMNTVFVYTSDFVASEPADYPQVYAHAETFVKDMGFAMEPVNLSFSPAMREVIIKGFRVMRPPPAKKQPLRQAKATPATEPRKLRPPTPPPAVAPVVPEAPGDLATELESLQRELASAKAVIEQITRDKVSLEQSAIQKIASLKASYEQALEAKRKTAELYAAEVDKHKREASSTADRHAEEEMAALKAEIKAVADAAKTTEQRFQEGISSLRQRVKQLEHEKLILEQQQVAANTTNAEQLSQFAAEKESLLARIAAEETAALATADRIAALEIFEASWKEGQQREEDLCRSLDLLNSELEKYKGVSAREEELQQKVAALEHELKQHQEMRYRDEELQHRVLGLETELQAAKEKGRRGEELQHRVQGLETELQAAKEKGRREEELQLKIKRLEEELAAAKAEREDATSPEVIPADFAAEMKALQAEKMAIEAEYVRLANESREKELEMLDTLAAAEMEAERLAQEMEIQVQVSTMEHAALRAELRRLIVSGASAGAAAPVLAEAAASGQQLPLSPPVLQAAVSSPVAAMPVPVQAVAAAPQPVEPPVQPAGVLSEPEPLPEADLGPDRPIAPDTAITSRLMNEFGSFASNSGYGSTEFSIDPALTAVDYRAPEEIVVLLYSSNTVQAVPDSSSIQRCKGFVVVTKTEGLYRVYVAWYLTESKKVVVCTPQQQPTDSEECVSIMQDAVAYFEIVGFMMEVEELGASAHSYSRALKRVPVLRRVT